MFLLVLIKEKLWECLVQMELENLLFLKLLLLGTVFTAAPHTLLANSLRYLKAASISLISRLQPVYGAGLGFILLAEIPEVTTFIGGLYF